MDELLKEQDYDPQMLNDFGGGNVSWWHNYIRYEVERCNFYWRSIIEAYPSQPAVQADAKKCANCGAELEMYCKKCFNSGAKERTA